MGPGTLRGKVALVTGAARGQGRAHALKLAEAGAAVIAVDACTDIDAIPYPMARPEELAATVRGVESHDRPAVGVEADVRDFDSLRDGVETAIRQLGRIDIVVANAGVVAQELGVAGWEISAERWRALVDVNLTGTWHTLKATVPTMIAGAAGGAIVIVSSTAGLRGIANIADYTATKHGLVGLMRSFALELAPHRIRVNTIHPTGVATPMIENEMIATVMEGRPELAEDLANLLPVEVLQPEEVAEAVLWLVSDAARNVTSVALPVDAGFTQK